IHTFIITSAVDSQQIYNVVKAKPSGKNRICEDASWETSFLQWITGKCGSRYAKRNNFAQKG
ncbi:hypothetical protein, partial [Escherichia coli]|uniref:hypothetical protein n=1 Tax=Escherichia coli TaxID=562 RepID=UPI001BD978D7